jgi:hypothetical protein
VFLSLAPVRRRPEHHRNGSDALHFKEETWTPQKWIKVEGIWSISVVFRSTPWPTSSSPSWFNTLRFLWISALVCRLVFDDLAPACNIFFDGCLFRLGGLIVSWMATDFCFDFCQTTAVS